MSSPSKIPESTKFGSRAGSLAPSCVLEIVFLICWPSDFQAWFELASLTCLNRKQVEDLMELAADHCTHARARGEQLVELP
jgi:hypothetical protein